MYKKAGDYTQARKLFAQMPERGIPQSTVTFNSLMSFEADYKEVSSIYDQVLLQLNSTISMWCAVTDLKIQIYFVVFPYKFHIL
jgi:pentatricopeptide repeat protein